MISFKKLVPTNLFDLHHLNKFYSRVYVVSFPDVNERESYNNILDYLLKQRNPSMHEYAVALAFDDGYVIGGCIYNYFARSNSGFIEFLAVDQNYYGQQIATRLFDFVKDDINTVSNKFGHNGYECLFAEMDNPLLRGNDTPNYKFFNNKLGFRHIDIEYVQPPLEKGKSAVTRLWFIGQLVNGNKEFQSGLLKTVLHEFYMNCLDIEYPDNNKYFINTLESFKDKDLVTSSPLL